MATLNGSAAAVFAVTLSEAVESIINVGWKTVDGTGVAGVDYEAASGTVTFLAGETSKNIQVNVLGRDPADAVDERSFYIDLTPPVGAILSQARAECVISVVSETGGLFTTVYLPAGPRGRPGDKGNDGLSAYELAVIDGFVGTLAEWLATITGRNVELRKGVTFIQWRVVGDPDWIDLIAIADLVGEPGENGKPVQMQKGATHIQWRLEGDTAWTNLIAIADLKGDKGDPGTALRNRQEWVSGTTYNPGDYVSGIATNSTTAKSLYFLVDTVSYISNTPPKSDLAHWMELQPPQGVDGREVQMQASATHIQWRYAGEAAWTNLVALADLKGADGKNVELQKSSTHVQWRVVGDTTWNNLIPLADITGANGRNVELQKTATYVQWRLVGDTAWINLIPLAYITGANGKNVELQKSATHVQWRLVGDTTWINLIALTDITGPAGTAGSVWYSGTGAPANGTGVINDFYLRNDGGSIYKKTAAAVWTLQMTIGSDNIVWYSGTTVPVNTLGKDGDLHLHENTGQIRKRVSGVWTNLILIPLLATSAQAKEAALSTVAATPAGVREFIEQYGWTANYMNDSTDLNTVTAASDRTVAFGFNNTTANTPVAGSYGRGIMIAGGGNYSTQIVWLNGTGAMYFRFHNDTTWTAWAPFLLAASNKWTGIQYFDASKTHIGAAWPGSAGIEFGRTDGVASTPYMDFHAGATVVDHDCRILVSNGTGAVGSGVLSIFGSAVRPGVNNVTSLGDASIKWNTVYATNATINTSDARLKTNLREMTLPEIAAFSTIARLPNLWKWIEKQEAEGEDARLHSGPTVQAAIAVMGDNGLNWEDYSCFCYDSWEATEESVTEVDGGEKVLVPARSAGDMYSFRREELLMLITRALAYKQDELEERLAAIEARLDAQ